MTAKAGRPGHRLFQEINIPGKIFFELRSIRLPEKIFFHDIKLGKKSTSYQQLTSLTARG
jgi:hypothetical protein